MTRKGHVLGEYDSQGNPLKETAYIGDLPVGVLSKSGSTYTIYSLLPDWIGAPHIIANSSGTFAWTWDHVAWGDNTPNQNPGGLGTFVYDWRFPGQVYDAESGIFYNMARDYNPTLSRYVESDPIGLKGRDYSTYGYAIGNPVLYTDLTGLSPDQICLPRDSRCPFFPGTPINLPEISCSLGYKLFCRELINPFDLPAPIAFTLASACGELGSTVCSSAFPAPLGCVPTWTDVWRIWSPRNPNSTLSPFLPLPPVFPLSGTPLPISTPVPPISTPTIPRYQNSIIK